MGEVPLYKWWDYWVQAILEIRGRAKREHLSRVYGL
jgi:hypothetical protein